MMDLGKKGAKFTIPRDLHHYWAAKSGAKNRSGNVSPIDIFENYSRECLA